LSNKYGLPIMAVHAPCLIISQRVWSRDPIARLDLAARAATRLRASTVVVHPPFRWQRDYSRGFAKQVEVLEATHGLALAVENMYPLRARGRQWCPYHQHWDPSLTGFRNYTLDFSHAAVARTDATEIVARMGKRLRHIHLGDGTGRGRDEHLVPSRGVQPCGEVLSALRTSGFKGAVAVEVSTRHVKGREAREADLAEALSFARRHLAAQPVLGPLNQVP